MTEQNEVLEELWKARREIEKRYGDDIHKINRAYLEKQNKNPSDYHIGAPVTLPETMVK